MSYADKVFKEMCQDILKNGTDTKGEKVRPVWEDGTPAYTIKKFCVVNRYDLSKEFPALTLRKTAFRSCVDEMLWIWQKKCNLTEKLNSKIWDSWTTPVLVQDEITHITPEITESFASTYQEKVEFEREVYNIGYFGNFEAEDIKEYFGEYFEKWVMLWEDMIKKCAKTKKHTPSVHPDFQSCEKFLRFVMDYNHYGKDELKNLTISREYNLANNYTPTPLLLIPEEYVKLLKKKWYFKDGQYFFSKLSLAKYLKNQYCINFVVTKANDEKEIVSDEIDAFIKNKKNNVKVINPKKENKNGEYPRFYIDRNHSIGTAYGYQLGVKHKYKEGLFDQVDRVIYDLKNNPYSRRIMTNIYVHQDLHSMGLYPCAYSMTFNVTEKNGKKILNGILNQRSQDVLAANNWNVVQYSVLLHMIAQVCDMQVGEFVHVIADAHIYDRHIDAIKEMLSREPMPAPKFWINPEIKNFYDFTVDDVKLIDYETHPQIKGIPVAI